MALTQLIALCQTTLRDQLRLQVLLLVVEQPLRVPFKTETPIALFAPHLRCLHRHDRVLEWQKIRSFDPASRCTQAARVSAAVPAAVGAPSSYWASHVTAVPRNRARPLYAASSSGSDCSTRCMRRAHLLTRTSSSRRIR